MVGRRQNSCNRSKQQVADIVKAPIEQVCYSINSLCKYSQMRSLGTLSGNTVPKVIFPDTLPGNALEKIVPPNVILVSREYLEKEVISLKINI